MKLLAIVAVAIIVAVSATLAGGVVSQASVVDCSGEPRVCETVYESRGWPIPWRTDAPPQAIDELLHQRRVAQLYGMHTNWNGVFPYAFGASLALWFVAAAGSLVIVNALITGSWRTASTPRRFAIFAAGTVGLAAVITILGTLITSSGTWGGVPYESEGWPVEWKTSPWLQYEPNTVHMYDVFHALVRPFNVLGFSPCHLASNVFLVSAVLFFIEGAIASILIVRDALRRPGSAESPSAPARASAE